MEEMNAVKAIDMAEGYLLKSLFEHESNGAPDVIIKDIDEALQHIRAAQAILSKE